MSHSNIIDFEKYKEIKTFNRYKDPCSDCDISQCNYTCDKAKRWWDLLVEELKGK